MQSKFWVFVRRGGVASLLVALFLLCLPSVSPVGTAAAQAVEANQAVKAPLAPGSGYGRPGGSARVRAVQRRLRAIGQQPGPVDGLYGPLTQAAVKRFQSSAGLSVDGIAGPHTLRALHAEWPQPVGQGAGYGQSGGSAQVRMLQRHLRRAEQRPGPVDGVFGPRTEAAVLRFQSSKGLAADGVVGSQTWHALERARTRTIARRETDKADIRRALAEVMPRNGARRSTLMLSKLPTGTNDGASDEPDVSLLVLLLIAATAFAAATLTGMVVRRRALAPDGHAVAVPAGAALAGTAARRGDDRAGARPRRPAQQDRKSNPSSPPFAASAAPDSPGAGAVRAVGYVGGADPNTLTGPAVRKQIAAIDALCDQRGWELVEIVRDVRSPAEGDDARALSYALERLAGEGPSCLVVAELGRLGRSADELGHVIRSLREREVRLVAIDADLDTGTDDGRLAAEALLSVSQLNHGATGRPAVDDLPALRKHIVAMRSSGMTLQAIADRLNAEGVPTLRGGKMWRPSSVQVALGYRRPGQARVGSLPQGQLRSKRERR
jgi:peptidoglycan hydrolase-like protein with peptidoglycan-binding domain